MKNKKPYTPPKEEEIISQQKKIGKRMQQLRKEKGFKNYELFAYEHGLSRAQYGRYEGGQDLRISTLIRVIHALGVTPEEFFKGM